MEELFEEILFLDWKFVPKIIFNNSIFIFEYKYIQELYYKINKYII